MKPYFSWAQTGGGADWRGCRPWGENSKKTLEKPLFSGVFCLSVL